MRAEHKWQSQWFRKGKPKTNGGALPSPLHLHVHLAPLHRGLWEAVNGDVSKSTQGPVPTSYQLTPSLKTNGIFLALNTFAGGQSPRKRLDSSWPEKEFLERVSRKGSGATVPSGVPKCSPTSPSTCPQDSLSSPTLSSLSSFPCPAYYIHHWAVLPEDCLQRGTYVYPGVHICTCSVRITLCVPVHVCADSCGPECT